MRINLIFISFLTIYLSSCSTTSTQVAVPKQTEKTSAEIQAENQAVIQSANEKMEKIVKETKEQGEDAVKFLSGDLFIKANDASLRGDSQTAAFLYKHLLELNPNNIFIEKKYGVELVRVGELDKALVMFETIEKQQPKDEDVLLILAGIYTAKENEVKARVYYEKVLAFKPTNDEACVFLAKSYIQTKKKKKALSVLTKCERKAKKKGIFSYYKGKIEVEEQNYKKAEKHFNHSLKLQKDFYQSNLALGIIYEQQKKFNKAKKVYVNYLKDNEDNYTVLSRLVQLLFTQGDFEEVIPYAEKLSNLDSGDLNLKVKLGILYTDASRFDDAIGIFKEVLVAVPNSDKIHYYLASIYQKVNKFEEAVEHFNIITPESSLFTDSHLQIANILQARAVIDPQNHEKEFLDFIANGIAKHKDISLDLIIIKASYYESTNKVSRAIASIEDYRKDRNVGENQLYYLASLYEKNDEFDPAKNIIEEILEKNPENAHALNFLGYSLLERGVDLEKSLEYIQAAVTLRPEDGYIRDSLGWYYYKTGQLEMALKEVKKAWELVKNDLVITKHLAIIYRDLEKYTLAKRFFEKALKQCKIQVERDEIQTEIQQLEKKRLPASK